MSTKTYKQCILSKDNSITISWVPVKLARPGRKVRIKLNNRWEEGWRITTVFDEVINDKTLEALQHQYKNTRKTSDI